MYSNKIPEYLKHTSKPSNVQYFRTSTVTTQKETITFTVQLSNAVATRAVYTSTYYIFARLYLVDQETRTSVETFQTIAKSPFVNRYGAMAFLYQSLLDLADQMFTDSSDGAGP